MKKILLILILLSSLSAKSQLKFNELMTNNVSALMDDAYNYSMWVELYNTSTIAFNQNYYYITDNRSKLTKWTPPSYEVPAKGYNVLWFERDDRTGHASFKLDPEGGKLYLVDVRTLQFVDSVVYPAQYRNISYGRLSETSSTWGFFNDPTPKASNATKRTASDRCSKPVFRTLSGFYTSSLNVSFENPAVGDTIFYTLTGVEPTRTIGTRYIPGAVIPVSKTSFIRAKCFSANKLSSDVVSSSFFINERDFKLPVISIITNPANLTDNTIGIYCDGTNGITGNGQTSPRNYNQDWDRPVNFELFDTTGVARLNQELDVTILGGWTRANGQKSLAIEPKKKFGENSLNYDIFAATKPNHKYKDIQIRNSGNDFTYSMMRDGFMESIVMKRMELDYLAYEPAVCFMNGIYYGIQNLRERAGDNFVYSNHGYKDDEIRWIEATPSDKGDTDKDMGTDTEYNSLITFINENDVTDATIYTDICGMMDVEEYMNYMIAEIFYANTDWPHNNVKIWKKTEGGKWRWILFDTDFGFNLYSTNYTHNTLTYAMGEHSSGMTGTYGTLPDWSTAIFRRLMLNPTFQKKFIDRYSIHLSTTFETSRVNHIMDSIAAKITNEIAYHKAKWGSSRSFTDDIANMKTFSANRPANMLNFISARFLNSASIKTIKLSANVPGVTYKMNSEPVIDPNVTLNYFNGRSVALEANPISGYKFKQWELAASAGSSVAAFAKGSAWKYNDGNAMPATNWYSSSYSDASWKSGNAQFGYGGKGEVTTIGYGGVTSNKYPTAYFRKTVSLTNLSDKSNFVLAGFVDDGAAVYVNGTEIGRYNLPTGTLTFSSLAPNYNNGENFSYTIPKNLLVEGNNVIAVEVHQNSVTSSDLIFDMGMTYDQVGTVTTITTPIYSTVLNGNIELKAIYEVNNTQEEELPTIAINEVVASNTLITDANGESDDYVELYNYGTKDINIAGWYFTDTPVNQTLCQIPTTDSTQTLIPAKGRIILWADNQSAQGVLHVGCKLSKDGESLVLSRKNAVNQIQIVDSVSFPALASNMSYSRMPDGGSEWVIKATTYNASNNSGTSVISPVSKLEVYPTMVKDHFFVRKSVGQQLTIVDLTGKVLLRTTCASDKEQIEVAFLKQGLYILTVGNESRKIVKL